MSGNANRRRGKKKKQMKTDNKDRIIQNLQQERLRGYLSTKYGQKCGVHHGSAWVQSMEGSTSLPYAHLPVTWQLHHGWRTSCPPSSIFGGLWANAHFCQIHNLQGVGHTKSKYGCASTSTDRFDQRDWLTLRLMISQISYRSSPSSQC